ncbi:hypothetical protein VTL71DRAFT_3647 [Oculimacula yallundae]|uniref:Uncharacterized protein n=1 Tax=Oculimacula yallundae TaxID=86028 RepID=A0ABR4C4B2_9HELO
MSQQPSQTVGEASGSRTRITPDEVTYPPLPSTPIASGVITRNNKKNHRQRSRQPSLSPIKTATPAPAAQQKVKPPTNRQIMETLLEQFNTKSAAIDQRIADLDRMTASFNSLVKTTRRSEIREGKRLERRPTPTPSTQSPRSPPLPKRSQSNRPPRQRSRRPRASFPLRSTELEDEPISERLVTSPTPGAKSVLFRKKIPFTEKIPFLDNGSDPTFRQWRASVEDRIRINADQYPDEYTRRALV